MTQANILELAKKGDSKAIAFLINRQLNTKGITAKVILEKCCLQIILEFSEVLNSEILVEFIRKFIAELKIANIERIKICGKNLADNSLSWVKELEIISKKDISPEKINVNHQPYNHMVNNNNLKTFKKTNNSKIELSFIQHFVDTVLTMFNDKATIITIFLLIITFVVAFVRFELSLLLMIATLISYGQTPSAKAYQEKQRLLEPKNQIFIKGLANENEQVVHYQAASYRGGIKGYPNQGKISGYAFVLDDYFIFYDNIITWKIPYKKLIEAKLDNFQMEEERALRALYADAGRQLQETKNTLELIYLDAEGIERNARFQIHGASTIPGEEIKAREFLNYILEFKNKFFHKAHSNGTDISLKLEKLMELKDKGLISESEFQAKKGKLLEQL